MHTVIVAVIRGRCAEDCAQRTPSAATYIETGTSGYDLVPGRACSETDLAERFDLAGAPFFGEERLQRAVQRRIVNQPLPGMVWIQLPRLTPSGWRGPK